MNEIINLKTKTEIEIEIVKTSIKKTISLKSFDRVMLSTNFKLSAITVRKKTLCKKMSKETTIQTRKARELEKNRDLINVIIVMQTKVIREKMIKHFFIFVIFKFHDDELIIFKIMIDSKTIFNFISQVKIKKMKLDEFDNISSDSKTFDKTSLRVYQEYIL